MATKKVMKQVLDKLVALQKKVEGDGWFDSRLGICSNSKINTGDPSQMAVFHAICQKWKHYSGNPIYPVHTDNRRSPIDQYLDTNNIWIGEYGKRRKELLLFVINELKRQLKAKPRRKK